MRAKTHPRVVGAFVLGAIVLVLAAIVLLSSESWFVHRDRFTVYFPGSVKGLNPGAAVTFRGIKVGEVADVQAFLTGLEDPLVQIEVVIEVSASVVETPPGVPRAFPVNATAPEFAQWLIQRGIRARMMSSNLITGQRYVDLDFLPAEPARFIGLRPRYPQLPTTPTTMEKMGDKADEFFARLGDLPLAEMLEDVRKAIGAARKVMESRDLKQALSSANRTARNLESRLDDLHATLDAAQRALGSVDKQANLAGDEARKTLEGLRDTLARTQKSLDSVEGTLRGTDEARVTATQALQELGRTMQALRNLVDYIQTHPETIVMGKEQSTPKEKK